MTLTKFVHDATAAAQPLRVEVVSGAAFELAIGLSTLTRADRSTAWPGWVPELDACSPALRRDVERVGRRSAELWLHLLGLALERPDDLAGAVRDTPAPQLRRHLAGVHVPAWRALVGAEALEATARGDDALLDDGRYYAGQARDALGQLLPLTPAETKRRVLAVLERFTAEVFDGAADVGRLAGEADAIRRLDLPPLELVEVATAGYRYEPEPGLDRVALVPHLAARPWLFLCQHARTRIVCFPVRTSQSVDERALLLGRALADEGRVRMVRRLAAGDATRAVLADTAGVARSPAHHHLSHLRAAGLVTIRGNARAYSFTLRRDGLRDAQRTLRDLGH
jgi:DNA-binding transcriptional ArsR family regulator